MNQYLSSILLVLHYISLPIRLLFAALYSVVQPLYHLLAFLTLPFIYLGRFMAYLAAWPFLFLARFETLYIYIGVASLVGIATGGVVYGILQLLVSVFHLDFEERTPEVPKRTVASYRAARRKKKANESKDAVTPPMSLSRSEKESNAPLGLLSQTILEEEDSDF